MKEDILVIKGSHKTVQVMNVTLTHALTNTQGVCKYLYACTCVCVWREGV